MLCLFFVLKLLTVYLLSDLSDIWDRLFSHRPFLQGEIKYFLSEFDVR